MVNKKAVIPKEITNRFNTMVEGFKESDKLYVNRTSYNEWRSRWLPAFAAYFYKAKNSNGDLIDSTGDVYKYWNGRLDIKGVQVIPSQSTHIVNGDGTLKYIIPPTLSSISSTLITDPEVELPLSLLTAETLRNPVTQLIPMELHNIFRRKMTGDRLDETEALKRTLMMDYIFVQEGYKSLLGLHYNPDGSYVLLGDSKSTVEATDVSSEGDNSGNFEYEDID